MRVCGVNSLVMDYFSVKTHDIWEGENVTTRREIYTENEHIRSLGFRNISERVMLQREVRVLYTSCVRKMTENALSSIHLNKSSSVRW